MSGQRIRKDGLPARVSRAHDGRPLPADKRSAPRLTPARPKRTRAERGQETPYTGRSLPPPPRPPLQGGEVRVGLGRIGKHSPKGAPVPGAREGMAAYRAHQPQPERHRDDRPRDKVRRRREALLAAFGVSS